MQRALAGDPQALGAYEERMRCVPRILSAQNGRSGHPLDEHDLADLAQDVSMLVWKKLSEFEGTSALETWVYRFCHLQFMNARRHKARLRLQGRLGAGEDREHGLPEPVRDRFEDLYEAIASLPPDERWVVEQRLNDETTTFEELALAGGLAASTLKTRYYKGLERLAAWLSRGEARAADRAARGHGHA